VTASGSFKCNDWGQYLYLATSPNGSVHDFPSADLAAGKFALGEVMVFDTPHIPADSTTVTFSQTISVKKSNTESDSSYTIRGPAGTETAKESVLNLAPRRI
jgi:hypothetical protein